MIVLSDDGWEGAKLGGELDETDGAGSRFGKDNPFDPEVTQPGGTEAKITGMAEERDFADLFILEQRGGGIGSDDVGTEDHLAEHSGILDGNALGAIAEKGPVAINDIEIRFTPCGKIGDTLVQIVSVPPTAVPDDAH